MHRELSSGNIPTIVEHTVVDNKHSKGGKTTGGSGLKPMKAVRLKPAPEATVLHQALPPRPVGDKRIHPRRPLPLIREADEDRSEGAVNQANPNKPGRSK